jgi:hypothetical protein
MQFLLPIVVGLLRPWQVPSNNTPTLINLVKIRFTNTHTQRHGKLTVVAQNEVGLQHSKKIILSFYWMLNSDSRKTFTSFFICAMFSKLSGTLSAV